MMIYPTWCYELRKLRESRGLRQQDVADGIGKSRSQYCAIEQARSVVNYKVLYDLARVFRLTMAQLVSMDAVHTKRNKKGRKEHAHG